MLEHAAEAANPPASSDRVSSRDLPGSDLRGPDLNELMARYQNGDPAAVDELVRSLSPILIPFLASAGFPQSDTDDLFQDCWMRIHRSRHTYRSSEPLLPWVFAIARHARLDAWRRRRRRNAREVLLPEPPETVHPTAREFTGQENFHRLLTGLPDSQREVIVMLKVSGMSLEEVARATSSTVGAIKQKAHRAYATLRRILEAERP